MPVLKAFPERQRGSRRKGIHLPFPFENLNFLSTHPQVLDSQSGCDPIMQGAEEVLPPDTEGPGIVTINVLDGVKGQVSGGLGRKVTPLVFGSGGTSSSG